MEGSGTPMDASQEQDTTQLREKLGRRVQGESQRKPPDAPRSREPCTQLPEWTLQSGWASVESCCPVLAHFLGSTAQSLVVARAAMVRGRGRGSEPPGTSASAPPGAHPTDLQQASAACPFFPELVLCRDQALAGRRHPHPSCPSASQAAQVTMTEGLVTRPHRTHVAFCTGVADGGIGG